jgi:hypothetical protein
MKFDMLVVETHSYCNRKCSHCIRQVDPGNKRFVDGKPIRSLVPTETVDDILRQAKAMGFKGPVSLYYFSEPFLDDRILHFARVSRALGMSPRVATNGDVLKKDDKLARNTNVFSLVQVSLYGARDAQNVRKQQEYWRRRLRCPVIFQVPTAIGDRPHLPAGAFGKRKTYPTAPCLRPLEKLIVQFDGSCPICCYDAGAEIVPVNAFEVGLKSAWNHPSRVAAVERLRHGERRHYPLCLACPMPTSGRPQAGMWTSGKEGT